MNLKLSSFVVTCALVLSIGVTFERCAYAYVDPGSSLLVFQSLSAIFTGGLFYFRKRLRSLISRSKNVESASERKPQ